MNNFNQAKKHKISRVDILAAGSCASRNCNRPSLVEAKWQISKKLSNVSPSFHNSWALCWFKDRYKESGRSKEVWRGKSGDFFERSTGSPHFCFGRWVRYHLFLFRENLKCVPCSWGTSLEPQRAKSDFRLGSDSLGNVISTTSPAHGLDSKARKGAVLGIAQSWFIRPRISDVSSQIPCGPCWGGLVLGPT